MCARERASLGATCVGEPVLLTVPVHGASMACVREHACFLRYASTGFVQCARADGFAQGARGHEIVRVSVGFCAVRALKSFVQCARAMSSCPCSVLVWDQYDSWAGACANEVVCESVRFVLVCGSVYRGAHVQSQYHSTVLAHPGFVQCASVLARERV